MTAALTSALICSTLPSVALASADVSILGMIFGECECKDTFDCSNVLDANGGIVLWLLVMLYMFKALGTVCDEYFVPALEMISEKLELSNDVAGATFMAAGSSAPELFTSLVATFLIVNEGGVGTIIGSAIFNILVIVGATCLFAGQELHIWWYPLARDCTFYILAIIELTVALADSEVFWYEGLVMSVTYFVYIYYMKINIKVVNYLGGPPGEEVEDVQDPETGKPEAAKEAETAEKADGPNGDQGLRAAAQPDSEQPPPVPKVKEMSENPNSGDVEVEPANSLHQPQDAQPNGGDSEKKEGDEQPATEEQPATRTSKLAVPGVSPDVAAKSPAASPRGDGTSSHHVHWSGRELHDHKLPHSHQEAEAPASSSAAEGAKGTDAQAEEAEEPEGRQCPDPLNKIWELVMPTPENYWRLFLASISAIAVCTYLMVDAVNRTGCNLNVAPLIMGLVFLSAGTSVPDALGSIAVAKQGEGDMAVANAFGSNVFDILLGLGVPWFISTACLQKAVVFPGAGESLIEWIIILAAILVLFIAALVLNKWKLNRIMGMVLMGFYLVYVCVALIRAFTSK